MINGQEEFKIKLIKLKIKWQNWIELLKIKMIIENWIELILEKLIMVCILVSYVIAECYVYKQYTNMTLYTAHIHSFVQ